MSKELTVFHHEQFGSIRSIVVNGEPWFVGKDVAEALGYSKARNAIAVHVEVEDKKEAPIRGVLGGTQEMTVINESGLYSLVLSSKLETAKQFKRWVTAEVLPTIRKTGGVYLSTDAAERILNDPDFIISMATMVKSQRAQLEAAKPKVEYYDRLVDYGNNLSIRDTAKALNISERLLAAMLIDKGFLYRDQKNRLRPYAHKNKGYFVLKEFNNSTNGYSSAQTLITVEGRHMLLDLLRKERGDMQ